jgi:hypothetical protein
MSDLGRAVHVYFCYDEEMPTSGLSDLNEKRNASVFASLGASGWPKLGESRMYWNNTFRLGSKYCIVGVLFLKNIFEKHIQKMMLIIIFANMMHCFILIIPAFGNSMKMRFFRKKYFFEIYSFLSCVLNPF